MFSLRDLDFVVCPLGQFSEVGKSYHMANISDKKLCT